jgi:hypothetical protein
MRLSSPDRGAPGSRLADWLELSALRAPGRALGRGELLSVLRPEDDDRAHRRSFDPDSGEILEDDILGESYEQASRIAFQELSRRGGALGDQYPFQLASTLSPLGRTLSLRARAPKTLGAVGYLLYLIISALRLKLLEPEPDEEAVRNADGLLLYSDSMFGRLFQICAAVALGGYIRGDVVSFGHPRPNHTGFLPAHQLAWERFGAYKPVSSVPIGLSPSQNDAGIDLISWLSFPDGHASKVLIFGQVASGVDWIDKSVVDSARALKSWFNQPTYENFVLLMAMPFNITDARTVIERGGDADIRAHLFEIEERAFGIVLDRDRIDDFSAFERVSGWVMETLARLGPHSL